MNTQAQECRPAGLVGITNKTPMEQCLIMLEASVDMLSNGLQEFYTRLDPILAQIPPSKGSGAVSGPQPGASPMVEKLHQTTQRIEFMTEALGEIRRRLEV